ncbi:MAG: DNA polymerase III subunit chi [Alphaproteobacteria bacterium]|nr:DNA polymerase III subunit chi [Alphaproteobacteria bacterium]
MSEIGFYHLQRQSLEDVLPKLLERVLERGQRAVVLAGSEERVAALDGHLWTYEERSWLPHGTGREGWPEQQPIFLTTREENPNAAQILVVVDGTEPAFVDRFDRVADLFNGRDEATVQAARERWSRYRAAGHQLTYWQQGERGGWEKKD